MLNGPIFVLAGHFPFRAISFDIVEWRDISAIYRVPVLHTEMRLV